MNAPTPEFDDGMTEFQDEWLSAYLDDELTDEQRQIVEDRLSVDPAAQTMLGDLERIRGLVRQLPGWDGKDLVVPGELLTTPTSELQSALDQEHDESAEDFHDDLRADTNSSATVPQSQFKSSGGSTGSTSWIRPLSIAASILLMLGLGYFLWPRSPFATVADSSRLSAPAGEADSFATEGAVDSDAGNLPPLPLDSAIQDSAVQSSEAAQSSEMLMLKQAEGMEADSALAEVAGGGMGGGGFDLQPSEDVPQDLARAAGRGGQSEAAPAAPALDAEFFSLGPPELPTNMAEMALPQADVSEAKLAEGLAAKGQTDQSQSFGAQSLGDQRGLGDPRLDDSVASSGVGRSARRDPNVPKLDAPARPPAQVYFGRSSSWADELLAREIAINPALRGLTSRQLVESGVDGLGNAEAPPSLPSPIVLARIPEKQDGEQFYNQLLQEQRLQPLANPEQLPAAATAAPPEKMELLGATDANSSEGRLRGPTQTIVLFVNRAEAESILQELDKLSAAKPAGKESEPGSPESEPGSPESEPGSPESEPGIQRYMWINPKRQARSANDAATRSEPLQEAGGPERVILLLNSAGN